MGTLIDPADNRGIEITLFALSASLPRKKRVWSAGRTNASSTPIEYGKRAPTGIWLDRCPPSSSGNATGQNFVDAATVEIDDLETPPLAVKTFADLRQMTEL